MSTIQDPDLARTALEMVACRHVPDDRLKLLIEHGGVIKLLELMDWDKPEPEWSEKQRRIFIEQVRAHCMQWYNRAKDSSEIVISSGVYTKRDIHETLIDMGRKLATMSVDELQAVQILFDFEPEEFVALQGWGERTKKYSEWVEGGRCGVSP